MTRRASLSTRASSASLYASARVDHRSDPGPVSRVVVGRVVLPVGAAAALAVGLYDFMRKMGIDPGRARAISALKLGAILIRSAVVAATTVRDDRAVDSRDGDPSSDHGKGEYDSEDELLHRGLQVSSCRCRSRP